MPALCIVDMQTGFDSHPFAIKGVLEQIELFKKHKWPIILVEYRHYGQTINQVMEKLEGYPVIKVEKSDNGGGEEVAKALTLRRPLIKNITMCGINTCYCVGETAIGLIQKDYNVKLSCHSVACQPYHQNYGCVKKVSRRLKELMETRDEYRRLCKQPT